MTSDTNAAVLDEAIAAWNSGDTETYLELYDEGVVLHGVEPGIGGVRSMYEEVWRRYPGSQLTLDDVIAEGDKLACRYTWRATDAKGGAFMVPGATIMHFRAGKCVERWDFEGEAQSAAH